jgi:hypothetical protein
MKNTSKLLYAIGFIINLLGVVITTTAVILLSVVISDPAKVAVIATDSNRTVAFVSDVLNALLIIFAIGLFIQIVVATLTIVARHNLVKKTGVMAPHIILLILGILSFNLLYLLGGIFAMVAASNEDDDDEDL